MATPQAATVTITPAAAADVAVTSARTAAVDAEAAAVIVTATSKTGPGGSVILHP